MKSPLLCLPGLLCNEELWFQSTTGLDREVHRITFAAEPELSRIAATVLAQAPPHFVLAGLSMGGYVAFEMLRLAPERIRGLCLVDTTADADTEPQVAVRREAVERARAIGLPAFAAGLGRVLMHARRGDAGERLSPSGLDAFVAMATAIGVETFALHQQAISRRVDSNGLLAGIACPAAVVVGAADRVTPPAVAERMAAAIPGASLHVVEEAGHLVPLEQPRVMRERLGAFLARCDGNSAS
jgi:pimeloyl-ACP methyl ester carboxylesterase